MDSPDNFDHIEVLKKRLYRREEGEMKIRRTDLEEERKPLKANWDNLNENVRASWLSTGILKKILTGAVIFFVITLGVAGFLFLRGSNVVSNRNINIAVRGPVNVKAGDVVALEIAVTNKNKVILESVDLLIEYPPGTRSAVDTNQELPRQRHHLGTINPGETATEFDRAVLLGEQNSEKEIRLLLEYRVEGSNTIFEKEQVYKLKITDSPISVTIDAPAEVSTDREIIFDIVVLANTPTEMKDILVVAAYPPGFQFGESSPKPDQGSSVWSLGDLQPGDERKIRVRGILAGQADEEKAFRAVAGVADERRTGVKIAYGEFLTTVLVKRPFVATTLDINNKSASEIIIKPEADNTGMITWRNSLSTAISDAQIEIRIEGDSLDESSVTAENGFYQSGDDLITWDKNNLPDLALIQPGAEGNVTFVFSTLPLITEANRSFKKPVINITMNFRGLRVSEGFAAQPVEVTTRKRLKVESTLKLVAQALYHTGQLTNSGPIPPKVGQRTTYTIYWSAINSSNDLAGARVRAVLPPYVSWVGQSTPQEERISYNERTREVVWDIGSLLADTGVRGGERDISFQVALTPSVSQVGQVVELISPAEISGVDTFTKTTLSTKVPFLSTRLTDDPKFVFGQESVVR